MIHHIHINFFATLLFTYSRSTQLLRLSSVLDARDYIAKDKNNEKIKHDKNSKFDMHMMLKQLYINS